MPPAGLIALELWTAEGAGFQRAGEALGWSLPGLGRSADLGEEWRALRVEPTVWWLSGPYADLPSRLAFLEAVLGDSGAVTDLSGAFMRVAVSGPLWRDLLMIGGVFDAEDTAFGPGATAGTILRQIGVRHDVVADDRVHIHLPPSYGDHLLTHLRAAAARLEAVGAREA